MPYDPLDPLDELTIPSRDSRSQRKETSRTEAADNHPGGKTTRVLRADEVRDAAHRDAPLAIQQYLQERIDLNQELGLRFPTMPVMSQIRLRARGNLARHALALIATQDGAASLVVEVDANAPSVEVMFVLNSMLGFKFNLARLTDMDRTHWLSTMKRALSEPSFDDVVFMWGAARWNSDYLICAPRRHFTNVYAFSPHHTECAVRLTSDVTYRLLEWLESLWTPNSDAAQNPSLSSW
jgi:hypothetical protein